jgi:transcriptional regulator with XRE-family HTH domain
MMLHSKSIGNKIAEARKKNNLSQAQLAQQISISPQAVGKWERGESMPDISTLNRLAEILGVDLNYFSESFLADEIPSTLQVSLVADAEENDMPGQRSHFDWNWDMSRGNWVDADFSGLKNLKEKFNSSNMKNCQFRASDLSGLTLGRNNIEACDFSSSNIRNSKIQFSNLLRNQFVQCSFIDATFTKCNIEKCDFSGADFSGVEFLEVNFENNTVQQSVWKFTSFRRSNLSQIIFSGLLEDCHFEQCSFYTVKFEDATIRNTFFKRNDRSKKCSSSTVKQIRSPLHF